MIPTVTAANGDSRFPPYETISSDVDDARTGLRCYHRDVLRCPIPPPTAEREAKSNAGFDVKRNTYCRLRMEKFCGAGSGRPL